MQNSYNDNRRHGVSLTLKLFVRLYLRVHTSHPGTNVYTTLLVFPLAVPLSVFAVVIPLLSLPPALVRVSLSPSFWCSTTICILRLRHAVLQPFTRDSVSPLLVTSICFVVARTPVLHWYIRIFCSSRRAWASAGSLPYRSRHSDFFFCFIFFSGDFLLICRTRS